MEAHQQLELHGHGVSGTPTDVQSGCELAVQPAQVKLKLCDLYSPTKRSPMLMGGFNYTIASVNSESNVRPAIHLQAGHFGSAGSR